MGLEGDVADLDTPRAHHQGKRQCHPEATLQGDVVAILLVIANDQGGGFPGQRRIRVRSTVGYAIPIEGHLTIEHRKPDPTEVEAHVQVLADEARPQRQAGVFAQGHEVGTGIPVTQGQCDVERHHQVGADLEVQPG